MTGFKNKKVLIMGLGLNQGGLGAARFFHKLGAKITVTDLRKTKDLRPTLDKLRGLKDIKFVLGSHKLKDFLGVDYIWKNPAISWESFYIKKARGAGVKILTTPGLFFDLIPKDKMIFITGTKGKTTTASFIHFLLSKKYRVKLLGVPNKPILDAGLLDKKIRKNDFFVVETSSFELEGLSLIKKSPHIAVITNIKRDHMDRYNSIRDYVSAKTNIFRYQKRGDWAVLNCSDEASGLFRKLNKKRVLFFDIVGRSRSDKVECRFKDNVIHTKKHSYRIKKLMGHHNIENIMASIIVAEKLNVNPVLIQKSIYDFKTPAGRAQTIYKKKGITVINDTTATNPDASLANIKMFNNEKLILITGGKNKKLNFDNLTKFLLVFPPKLVILMPGDASSVINKKLQTKNKKTTIILVHNLKEAVKMAFKNAVYEDTILFSPAAASFNMFKNEFDRGEKFNQAVKQYKK